ncbi:MAG: hypothetical protein EWM45_11665 [Rhodopseudomonas palustris]|nr:MAG: hypothetical protein EWM45_11665 [Rhodopseudomonas palustris]
MMIAQSKYVEIGTCTNNHRRPYEDSKSKLVQALELRDAALTLLDRAGLHTIHGDRGTRHHTRQVNIQRLKIMQSRLSGEQLLDIWNGTKIFSVAWDATERHPSRRI